MECVNVYEMDRTCAIVIFNGKIFEDDNHQYGLSQAYKHFNITDDMISNYSDSHVEENLNELCAYTKKMSDENILGCYSVFNDKYFVGHTKENVDSHINIIKEYAKEHDLIIGYFENFHDDNVVMY